MPCGERVAIALSLSFLQTALRSGIYEANNPCTRWMPNSSTRGIFVGGLTRITRY
jgi:hypothetical protein